MKPIVHMNIPMDRMNPAKYAVLFLIVAAVFLVAFGYYTGEPAFFLKWFFGLQADD